MLKVQVKIKTEQFINLLQSLGSGKIDKKNGCYQCYTGDYYDAKENLKCVESGVKFAEQSEIDRAIVETGMPIHDLVEILEAIYLVAHVEHGVMRFPIA